jgi:predicted Ser/Thr protein kinase
MATPNRGLADLSDHDRQELEAWLAEFDQRWVSGLLPEKACRIPPGSSWRLPALCEMVKIDLERQWGRGNRLSLENYLKEYPELGTSVDVSADLILAEYEVRKQFGAEADLDDYARRFPAQVEELRGLIAAGGSSPSLCPGPPSGALSDGEGERPRGRADAIANLPERFGRYRIIRRLGAGGMGSVYLAEDTRLKRKVALKVAHVYGSDGRQALERFRREAEAAARLDHPCLCKVYDVGEIDGVHHLTMEYIEGTTLAEMTEGQRGLPQREAAVLVRKLALALQEAHAQGVVHRDLKPANVMIRRTGEPAPVIVDFGLARQVDPGGVRLTQAGQPIGTPAYMSAEQVQGDLDATGPACDVYALGVILYELLTGRLPFYGPNPMVVVAQILRKQPAPPSSVRPDLDPRLEAV